MVPTGFFPSPGLIYKMYQQISGKLLRIYVTQVVITDARLAFGRTSLIFSLGEQGEGG